MDIEDKKKIDRALALSEENNKILKTLLRNMRWGRLFKTVYWLVILGVSVGAFLHFQPYIDQFVQGFDSFQKAFSDVNGYLSQ
jgi:hypothetical protein